MEKDLFGVNRLKVNLHMHTTLSDGVKTPQEAAEIYKKAGYDVIAVTDHWNYRPSGTTNGLRTRSGEEYNIGGADACNGGYHILGIGCSEKPVLNDTDGPQAIIDEVHRCGGIAILAHPAWSVMDPKGIENLNGITAAEIYNTVSDLPFNGQRADSSAWFDIWGTNYNRLIPAVASDDAHCYEGDQCSSYTMVNASELSRDGILDALQAGNFYASQKPVIHEMAMDWEKGIVHLEFSEDVMTVVFYSNHIWVPERVTQVKGGRMDYHIAPGEFFLRDQECGYPA